jgi:serine/threonine protein kinase
MTRPQENAARLVVENHALLRWQENRLSPICHEQFLQFQAHHRLAAAALEEMQAMLPQYEFECLLGRGGMGAVYKAGRSLWTAAWPSRCFPAIFSTMTTSQFAERFKNEARTMAKMNHPSIVNVYDFGETTRPGCSTSSWSSSTARMWRR